MSLLFDLPGRIAPYGVTAPIAQAGLRSLLLVHGGGVLDAVSGKLDQSSFGTLPSQLPGLDGGGRTVVGRRNPANTGGLIWYGSGAVLAPQNYTRVVVARVESSGVTDYAGLAAIADSSGATNYWSFQGDNTARAAIWHGGANGNIALWSDLANGRYQTFVFRSANSSTVEFWLDGVKQTSLATGAAPSSPPTDARAVFGGERSASTSYAAPCSIVALGTFDGLLSDARCAALSIDWRGLLAPRRIELPEPSVAAPFLARQPPRLNQAVRRSSVW